MSSGLDVYDSESESSGSEKEKDSRGYDSDEELKVRYFLLHLKILSLDCLATIVRG